MASIDLNADYNLVKDKVKATQAYNEVKQDYDKITKKAGDTFEKNKQNVTEQINNFKEQKKKYQKQIKNQFEQLLDIANSAGGKGSGSIRYIKNLLLQTLKNIEPKIAELLHEESINAVGCDQQQVFDAQVIYIKVSSIDLGSLLKQDPESDIGKVLYERNPITIQDYPFSMNRELYQRIQSGQPYSLDNGQLYRGASGQNLFDIQFVEVDNLGQNGPWYKITLQNRVNSVNKVGEFLVDYYKTVKLVDFKNIIAQIMEQLSGVISIQGNIGLGQAEDSTKFMILIQRILGLCFDNESEIDVSGNGKISEGESIDTSFFEFTEIDLRNIETRINNIKKGVVQFEDCDNVDLPLDTQAILNSLNNLNFVTDSELINAVNNTTDSMADNPAWQGLALQVDFKVTIDTNFVKLLVQGLIFSLLTPKILLPIMTMLKALGNDISDIIKSFVEFAKTFKKFVINLISKIGAIFVQELFNLIKRDIQNLIRQVITDLAKEKADKRVIMILKLISVLIAVAQLINDWRRCKSVVDELLAILRTITQGWGGEIPLPILFGSQLLEGYSATRAFIGSIEELQKLGIPTGPMPDGGPNLTVLSMFSQLKASSNEEAENGKVQIAVPPLSITPAGLTIPSSAFGKKM